MAYKDLTCAAARAAGRAGAARYRASEKGRASARARTVRYRASEKGYACKARAEAKLRGYLPPNDASAFFALNAATECAACHRNFAEHGLTRHKDHCHKTGQVRGALCSHCNLAIGHLQDSPERCQNLIAYLLKYSPNRSAESSSEPPAPPTPTSSQPKPSSVLELWHSRAPRRVSLNFLKPRVSTVHTSTT